MIEFNRKAGVLWSGDSRTGTGIISTESQALYELPFNYQTRFGDQFGVNPEELIAAAHAASFSMALANTLRRNGYEPQRTDTNVTCTAVISGDGHEITRMLVHVRAEVPDISDETFQNMVEEADKECPVSNLFRQGVEINIDATVLHLTYGT